MRATSCKDAIDRAVGLTPQLRVRIGTVRDAAVAFAVRRECRCEAAAGLDVYSGEPNIHPDYLTLPNVFVLPHLGSATTKTRVEMGNLSVSNLEEFFKTGKCKNTVN